MTVVNEYFVPYSGCGLADYLALGDRKGIHHLVRYQWACAMLAEKGAKLGAVLDIACGSGYGAAMLAERFPELRIVGADYDEGAVQLAQERYERGNVTFRVGDVTAWEETVGDEMFDVVVSFETIEHVSHREIMMQSVVDHLSPEGVLLLSTPIKSRTTLHPHWAHHRIEYSPRALNDFMHRYFTDVLYPDNGTLPCRHVIESLNQGDEELYLLRMNPILCQGPLQVEPWLKR